MNTSLLTVSDGARGTPCRSDLVDLSPRGLARASSGADRTDGWRPGDAQHAARPGRMLLSGREVTDYAFCTADGVDEYWEIEFPQPVSVDRVVVHDALGESGMHQACLRLESFRKSLGTTAWTTRHFGEVLFGAEPEEASLVVPFDGQPVDGVRITLCGRGRLRLFRVEMLGPPPRVDGKYVLCRPRIGGLADILNQVGMCYDYSVVHGRTLYVDGRQSGFHAELDEYFESTDERVVFHSMDPRLYSSLTHLPRFLDALPMDYRVRRDAQLRRVVVEGSQDVVDFDFDSPHAEEVLVRHQVGGYKQGFDGRLRAHEVWRWLRLTEPVRVEVVDAVERAGEYDAVHVRNTDLQTDYELLFSELDGMLGDRIVLATDDHRCKTYAERLWGDRMIPVTRLPDLDGQPLHYASLDKQDRMRVNIATLTDLMLLAGARRLFFRSVDRGSKQGEVSGFSSMAQYLHEHPEVRAAVLGATTEGTTTDGIQE